MSRSLLSAIKQASIDASDNEMLCDLRFGTVTSLKPLKVQVTNLFVIPESMLIVPEKLTDYEIETTIKSEYGWNTENESGGAGDSAFSSHNHDIQHTRKKIIIHNALKVDDKVVLVRKRGGQHYYILDRLPKE